MLTLSSMNAGSAAPKDVSRCLNTCVTKFRSLLTLDISEDRYDVVKDMIETWISAVGADVNSDNFPVRLLDNDWRSSHASSWQNSRLCLDLLPSTIRFLSHALIVPRLGILGPNMPGYT